MNKSILDCLDVLRIQRAGLHDWVCLENKRVSDKMARLDKDAETAYERYERVIKDKEE